MNLRIMLVKLIILQKWLLFDLVLFFTFIKIVFGILCIRATGIQIFKYRLSLFYFSSFFVKIILISLFRVCQKITLGQDDRLKHKPSASVLPNPGPLGHRHRHTTRLLEPWLLSPKQGCAELIRRNKWACGLGLS